MKAWLSRVSAVFTRLVLVWALALMAAFSHASPYQVETLAGGLEFPWSLAFLPDGQLLVSERVGRLQIINNLGEKRAVSGLPDLFARGQAGLKQVALAPDFAQSGLVYLSYSCGTQRANSLCLARARLADDHLHDLALLFTAKPIREGAAHYGGRLAFLPDDTLVLGLGDGFDYREQAQNPANHLGKLVRLNLDGSVPADNPKFNDSDAASELYTLGHRNVQGIVYDRFNQRLLIHEHGPKGGDELNLIKPGRNYGWPLVSKGIDYTGARVTPFTSLPGFEEPLLHWTPSIAPAGMSIYRGEMFSQWQGDLLIAALAGKAVYRVRVTDSGAAIEDVLFTELNARIRDVQSGPDGAVYLLTDSNDGRVLKITPARAFSE